MTQLQQVKKAVAFINKKTKNFKPEIALITGSGLAGSVPPLEKKVVISYAAIPGFLQSTVPGHSGNLIFGTYNMRFDGEFTELLTDKVLSKTMTCGANSYGILVKNK